MTDSEKLYAELHKPCCDDGCGCPTDNMFEQMAAQFGYRASNVNAVAMESFQLQVSAQNALLLKLQADVTKPST